MKVFEGTGKLVNNIFFVHLIEDAVLYGFENITVHVLKQKVDVIFILRSNDFSKLYDVCMVEFSEKGDLTIDALGVSLILKRQKNFFDCVDRLCLFAFDFPDVTIGPAADLSQDLIFILD
jgi:hypothetical protein